MAFEKIAPLPTADEIMQAGLAKGRKKTVRKKRGDSHVEYRRKKERERLRTITGYLRERLRAIPKTFPSIDELNEFYRELFRNDFSLDDYRRQLARVQNAAGAISSIHQQLQGRIDAATSNEQISDATGTYIGRVQSVLDDLEEPLTWLEQVRKQLRTYPRIKEQYTVCIAGFPNVGKTTLLTELTGSGAEINEYAFTTKSLNLGYRTVGHAKVQFVDTPGTLNRDEMNAIERQAHLALKYVADLIVYVYDKTLPYPWEDQEALREAMSEYRAPVLNYLSKKDLLSDEQITSFNEEHENIVTKEAIDDAIQKHRS